MEISSVSHSPIQQLSATSVKNLSVFEIEDKLIEAFKSLEFDTIIELLAQGGNPNQYVPITKSYILQFLEINFGLETEEIEQLIEMEPDLLDAIIEGCFEGNTEYPILPLTGMLCQDEVCCALLENGAKAYYKVEDQNIPGKSYSLTALELATHQNMLKTAEYCIKHLGLMPNEQFEQEDTDCTDETPFDIALSMLNEPMLRLFLEAAPNNYSLAIFKDSDFIQLWNEGSEDVARIQALFQEFGIDVPKA